MVDTWATVGSLRADRQARATSRAASASAACSSRCRPTRSSSRTTASSARAPKSSRASSSARARCCRWASSSRPTTKIVDRATGEIHIGKVPPYSVVVPGTLPGKPLPDGMTGPGPLLRRHRQDGRRADALQDQHQRAAAGLSARPHPARRAAGGRRSCAPFRPPQRAAREVASRRAGVAHSTAGTLPSRETTCLGSAPEMRWIRITAGGRTSFGLVEGDTIVEVEGNPLRRPRAHFTYPPSAGSASKSRSCRRTSSASD